MDSIFYMIPYIFQGVIVPLLVAICTGVMASKNHGGDKGIAVGFVTWFFVSALMQLLLSIDQRMGFILNQLYRMN